MIAEIQRKVLGEYLTRLATDRGTTIHPLLKDEIIDSVYRDSNRTAGYPLTFPFRQEPRSPFSVEDFNRFFDSVGLDIETLFKLAVRARVEARQMLMLNDIRMQGFADRIQSVNIDTQNFNSKKVDEVGIFESEFSVPIKFVDFYYRDQSKALDIDAQNNVIVLPSDSMLSRFVDLTFLNKPSSVTIATQAALSELVIDKSIAPFSNVGDISASPWIHNVTVNRQRNSLDVIITMELPNIEEINRIDIDMVPGGATVAAIETALIAENYIPVGSIAFSVKKFISLPVTKVKRIRIRLTNTPVESGPNKSVFMFGVKSLILSRRMYNSEGEAVLLDINPNVGNKSIISIGMQAGQIIPTGTSIDYALRLSSQDSFTEVSGESLDNETRFSIAKTFDQYAISKAVPFPGCPNRNGVNFSTITPIKPNGDSLLPTNIKVLERYAEILPEQNCLKKLNMPEYMAIDVQDARVTFGAVGYENRVDIKVPLTVKDLSLQTDNLSDGPAYILLPTKVAYNNISGGALSTVVDRIKTENSGIFSVEWYETSNPTILNPITSTCTLLEDNKVVVAATYGQNISFKVVYLGLIDKSVFIKRETLVLHKGTGQTGAQLSNIVSYSKGLYRISAEDSKIYATKTTANVLANDTYYLNFTGVFTIPKMYMYEGYVTFANNIRGLTLETPITVDADAGEYATLRSINGGKVIRLENTTELPDIVSGTYLLSILSKPMRALSTSPGCPSVIQSVLDANVDQTHMVTDPNKAIVKLFSMSSGQLVITRLGTTMDVLKYRQLASFLNRSVKYNNKYYSTAVVNDETVFIITESGYDLLPIDGVEHMSMKFMYFDKNQYNGQDTISLKIRMRNLSNQPSLSTPEISYLKFKLRYV